MSLLSGNIVSTFCFGSFDFALWSFLRFFSKLMEQNKGVVFIKPSAIILEQLDIESGLLVLNTSILTAYSFCTKSFKKVPELGFAISSFVKFNCVHLFIFSITLDCILYMDDSINAIKNQAKQIIISAYYLLSK